MKPASVVSEEILELLSEKREMSLAEIARKTSVSEEDAKKVLDALIVAGFITKKGRLLTVDPIVRDFVLSMNRV